MAKLDYEKMLKADWQKLATKHKIEYIKKSTVRYLVEKIAEKIGVDDKIVSTEELKKQVCEKLNSSTKKPAKKKSTKKKAVKKDVSKLDSLRAECTSVGLGWSEAHTEADLEQLLNAIKGNTNGQVPITDSIELDVANITDVADVTEPAKPEPFNPVVDNAGMQTFNDTQVAPIGEPSEVDSQNLDIYRQMFTNNIRGHWRVMELHEIADMFNQASYPFTHEIKRHPENSNQIEIILSSSGVNLRIPSDDKNDWINING